MTGILCLAAPADVLGHERQSRGTVPVQLSDLEKTSAEAHALAFPEHDDLSPARAISGAATGPARPGPALAVGPLNRTGRALSRDVY
jgi:hypothetical protein